ncbi:hypothetical protein BSL78_24247 [Apostichopus japonicus]|uniref:Virilizer N-terminal domain-containing protein n=1 Tax=Stichopus japonicus TaxID=307972 RepID=A0A2G8JT24_STIJA|nr:hypothetical protein BSL78_24247 [Apostichopus japonicus]
MKDVKLDLIQFPALVDVSELRVVPRSMRAHKDLKEDIYYGQTSPSNFKVEFFCKNSKNASAAIYQKIGNLDFSEKGHIQLIPKTKITTEHLVVRGRYHKLTLCVYGSIASQRESSESPPPPPPPPPPPSHPVKENPTDVKQGVEDISPIETIKSTSRPSNWDWEVAKESHPDNSHFSDFPSQNTESLEQKPTDPVTPHPPVRRGPRTPSPPPPPSTEQWENPEQGDHWSEEEPVSPEEWQTQDLWVEGQPTEPPPPLPPSEEPAGNWEENDGAWETTDSWEPQDAAEWDESERGEDWKRDQGDRRRKGKGPRTPPGEPRSPRSYESKRKRDIPENQRKRTLMTGREDEGSRRCSLNPSVQTDFQRTRAFILDKLGKPNSLYVGSHEDADDEEGMGEAYEEISDEEVLEDESFLENMDIDNLVTGGDVSQFDPFQFEPEPFKILTSLESLNQRTVETPTADDDRTYLQDLLSKEDDRGPKWVAALEEITNLLLCSQLVIEEEDTNKICDWTIDALDYSLAQKQPLAVNIRQLKAGMKLVSCLCNLKEDFTRQLVERDVLNKLLALLFEDFMASSLKLLIFKALDSVSNWQVGLDKFLDQDNCGYKKLLKFLMMEQTVRVVQAGSALLQKIHFYENLGTLKETVESNSGETVERDGPSRRVQTPSSLEETFPDIPESKGQPFEAEFPNIDESVIKKLQECLDEVQSIFKKDAALHQSIPDNGSTFGGSRRYCCGLSVHRMFANRDFLASLTLLLCCPSTACNLSVVTTVKELLSALIASLPGVFYCIKPEVVKVLFQTLTSSDEDEPDEFSLQQIAMEIMHKIAALQVLDSLMHKLTTERISEQRANLVECLEQAFSLTFNPVGREALADIFSKEDYLKYLLMLLRPKEPEGEAGDPQPKKNAVDGYLRHLLWTILQYSEDMNLLKKHTDALRDQVYDKDLQKWLSPLKMGSFDSSMAGPLVEYIHSCCDDLATDFTNIAPGILTCLRVLRYLTCTPATSIGAQQKNLSYQLAIMETFSSGGVPALSTCIKKISDFLLRPWQMGHCLTSKQQHLADTIALSALKVLKAILTEIFSTGEVQYKDDRPVSSLVSLHTVMCCAPPGGTLGRKSQEIHQDIIDILLTYTTAPSVAPQSTQVFSHILEGLVCCQTYSRFLTAADSGDSFTGRHHSNSPVKEALECPHLVSEYCLKRHHNRNCMFVLEAITSTLITNDSGNLEPSSIEVAQVLSLFVYLVSQPSIKAAFLDLINSSLGNDDPLYDILKKLLTLMNIPFESPAHLQAQECVVACLQSVCSPDITLLSDEGLSTPDLLANSLPGKEHMELISTSLLDHVTSPSHSYASILPALRMIATLLDHDYGFNNVKGALLKQQGILSEFYKRLTGAFTRDSSDYLSTLSTAVDLLHFLVSVESYHDDEQPDAIRYRTQALTAGELRALIKWESDDQPLKQLEKILVECCKEDEKLETLLDSLSSLLQLLDSADLAEKTSEPQEQNLPPPARKLTDQFSNRLVFFLSEEEDDRFVPGIWIGLPPMDEMDTDPEMVKCDLEEMRSTIIPDFNLKEELEKGLLTEDRSPDKPKHRRTGSYTALTSKGTGQFSNTIRRAHNSGFRGGKRNYDIFRQRAQNTSRPPSMHVDDFMNIENTPGSGENQYNRNQPQRRGMGVPRGSRGSRGGFRQWSGPSFRRDECTMNLNNTETHGQRPSKGMPRGRGQWGPGRKPMRSNYHQGPADRSYMQRRPDPRSEGRPPPRSPVGPQTYNNRPGSADRIRGPYRGMHTMGPRGSPSQGEVVGATGVDIGLGTLT